MRSSKPKLSDSRINDLLNHGSALIRYVTDIHPIVGNNHVTQAVPANNI